MNDSPSDLLSPLSEEEVDWLDDFLLSIDADDSVLNFSELDGFLTAAVSGPEMIVPSEWVDVIWGGSANQPELEGEHTFEHVFSLMLRHMNVISTVLMNAPEEYGPFFLVSAHDENVLIVDEWCRGYLKGVALRAEAWESGMGELGDALDLMALFVTEPGWKQLDQMSVDEVTLLKHQITPAVCEIFAYWLDLRSDTTFDDENADAFSESLLELEEPFVRSEPKVGRNEPCPCGSGKKYKKCCGLH